METATAHIDELNNQAFGLRYSDAGQMLILSKQALAEALAIAYEKGECLARLNLAIVYFLRSDAEKPQEQFSIVADRFEQHTEWDENVRFQCYFGNFLESIGEFEKGLKHVSLAYRQSHEAGNKEMEAEACSILGLIYTRLCNFNEALLQYNRALEIRTQLGDEQGMASSLNRIAWINRLLKNYEESLRFYDQSLAIRQKLGLAAALPWTYLGLGSTYEEMGEFEKALEYYQSGITGRDPRCDLQCKLGSSRVFGKINRHKEALEGLNEALRIANELNAKPLAVEVLLALANQYEKTGNAIAALDAFRQYHTVRESVLGDETRNKLRHLEISHAIEKSEQEKEIYRLKHVELKAAFDLIDEKNREITGSITYSRRIQEAILPDPSEIPVFSSHSFIVYRPKDIVSGDFYWFMEKNGMILFAVADCTGHGVPGALMSMLGISLLNEIVNKSDKLTAGYILNQLRVEIIKALHQTGKEGEARDGMDIALCIFDPENYRLQYAGAFNGIYIADGNEISEYPADHMPIGVYRTSDAAFTSREIPVRKGNMIYLFSDGFPDQFGGPRGKKFKYESLKNLLLGMHAEALVNQKAGIEQCFLEWQGNNEQTDDVTLLGLRIW